MQWGFPQLFIWFSFWKLVKITGVIFHHFWFESFCWSFSWFFSLNFFSDFKYWRIYIWIFWRKKWNVSFFFEKKWNRITISSMLFENIYDISKFLVSIRIYLSILTFCKFFFKIKFQNIRRLSLRDEIPYITRFIHFLSRRRKWQNS